MVFNEQHAIALHPSGEFLQNVLHRLSVIVAVHLQNEFPKQLIHFFLQFRFEGWRAIGAFHGWVLLHLVQHNLGNAGHNMGSHNVTVETHFIAQVVEHLRQSKANKGGRR